MSSLMILAASGLEISCGKTDTDTQTNGGENPTYVTAAGVGSLIPSVLSLSRLHCYCDVNVILPNER